MTGLQQLGLVLAAAACGLLAGIGGQLGVLPPTVWAIASAGLGASAAMVALTCVQLVRHGFVEASNLQSLRFSTVLDNMSQGLSFFDGDGRLMLCNRRYRELFGLTEALIQPGTTYAAMVAHREQVGTLPDMSIDEFLAYRAASMARSSSVVMRLRNGRVYASRHSAMPDGSWVGTTEDVTAQHEAEARIAHMAGHDMMTGLANRAQLAEHLDSLRGGAVPVALLVLDLDHFKAVNDSFGHETGDRLLCAVAERLRDSVREGDLVVRLGGDEFAIVQAHVDQPRQAEALARRVAARIVEPFEIGGATLLIGISIGIAVLECGEAADQALHAADIAMYQAKMAVDECEPGGRLALFTPGMAVPTRTAAAPEPSRLANVG